MSNQKDPGLEADTKIHGILKNGQEMVISAYEGKDTLGLYIYDLQARKVTRKVFHYDNHDASGVVFSKDGESIIGAKYTAERDETVLLNDNGSLLDHLRTQFFATRGYGVLQMNFRGSQGYGRAFKEAGRNNWIVMQEDVDDGARWLLEKGYADPEKTCIAGWSYGGYAALMGVATDPELYRCAIAMAALTDINDAKRDMLKYRGGRHAAKNFFGKAFKDAATRKANSPVNVANQIKVPVFLAHGDRDINVQFDQFTRMRRSLEKAGVDATYLSFKDEDHYLSRQINREAFFVAIEKFLLEVNGKSPYMKEAASSERELTLED